MDTYLSLIKRQDKKTPKRGSFFLNSFKIDMYMQTRFLTQNFCCMLVYYPIEGTQYQVLDKN